MPTAIHSKLISLSIGFFYCSVAAAQIPASAFSFSCVKTDTVSGCGQTCVTLTTRVPNISASSTTYTVNRISQPEGCFRQYITPAVQGNGIALLNDDSYSGLVNLPFDFPLFGTTYHTLLVSGNGYVSFDGTKAGNFSHYGILSSGFGLSAFGNIPVDLPSTLYDKALIMAPYQDLDNSYNTSPGKLVKYDVIGTAPHRRWILSYYQVPLYYGSCENLIQNSSQLVLYESTGIVEVLVYSKQICTGWNDGRAMIGMQDYDRLNGIMAPGRAASDSAWGSIGMNEAWRFTPAGGPSLFKRVELYTMSGGLVTTGSILDAGNGIYNVKFNNVCIDSTTSYIVKSTYEKFDDASVEVYGTDTLNLIKVTPGGSPFAWTGSVSTQWENPLNWSCNTVPGSSSNVIIAQGNITVNSNVTVNSLTVLPGVSLLVSPGYNITVLSAPH